MVRAILLTHGTLGGALMASVESVLGPQEDVIVLSNSGLALDQILESLRAHVGDESCIIFVDFCGGSPFMACKSISLSPEHLTVVSGVNLPMLLSFFTKRGQLSFAELSETVQHDGHRGIQLHSE